MRTRYSEDQQAVAEAFGELFAREASTDAVRAAEAGCGFDAGLWRTLAAAGAPGMAVAADYGGGGGSLVDLAVMVYEWGRRIAPVPLVEHAVCARLLAAVGGDWHRDAVAAVAVGELIATLAPGPLDSGGVARLVPAGAVADVVAARRADDVVVTRSRPPATARPNTADLPLADRDLSDAQTVASGAAAEDAWERALSEWKALTAVAYAGLAAEVLAMGVDYTKQRRQFGVPVGSFQAVQHGLADAATRTEGARLLAFRAVCALEAELTGKPTPPIRARPWPERPVSAANKSGKYTAATHPGLSDSRSRSEAGRSDGGRLASMALLFGAESARFAADRALQYHGGYGYSAEYDVQLYYRRAAGWLLQLGEPSAEIARLAQNDLGPKATEAA